MIPFFHFFIAPLVAAALTLWAAWLALAAEADADLPRSLSGQIGSSAGNWTLSRDLHVAHFVHASDSDIATIAGLHASVAHNPLSNMRLASGVMRYPEIQNAGIRIGLGLDGGTNDTTDMFNNMRVAVGLQRATSLDALGTPTIVEVLRAATL